MPEQSNVHPDRLRFSTEAWLITLRWIALTILIVAELAGARLFLAFPEFSNAPGPVARIIASVDQNVSVSTTGAFLVASTATLLLIISRRLGSVANDFLNQTGYRWWPWLASHAVAFMAFISLSWPAFGPAADGA